MKSPTPEIPGKTPAIIAYITIFGTILALFLNSETKSKFANFHIRQALGINLTLILFGVLVNGFGEYFSETMNFMIGGAFYLSYFILWIYGFIGAVSGKKTLLPIVGNFFQKFFQKLAFTNDNKKS